MAFDPLTSPTLEPLCEYLYYRMNELQPGAVAKAIVFSGAANSGYVQDVSALTSYPLLALHQESAQGEDLQRCQGGIEYLLPIDLQRKFASIDWVGKAISLCLREYHDQYLNREDLGFLIDTNFVCNPSVVGRGAGVFLSLNFRFSYWDRASIL